jgi:hypothetical protein
MKLLIVQLASYYFIPLRSEYFLSSLLSNILSICSSIYVSDQIYYRNKMASNFTVSHILNFVFLGT